MFPQGSIITFEIGFYIALLSYTYICLLITKHREANEEKIIQGPKSMLRAMRKEATFLETKLRLLNKKQGMDILSESYEPNNGGDWFKGFHTYENEETILERYTTGRPLSCLFRDNIHNEALVAFKSGKRKIGEDAPVSYVKFSFKTIQEMKEECGVHFCRFELSENVKETIADTNITDYAIMLPYRYKEIFAKQYTLVYSDWEVLHIEEMLATKKRTSVSHRLFSELAR